MKKTICARCDKDFLLTTKPHAENGKRDPCPSVAGRNMGLSYFRGCSMNDKGYQVVDPIPSREYQDALALIGSIFGAILLIAWAVIFR